jgi:uncharacterized cupin superfamily protein
VAFEASVREMRVYQQIWVLEGMIAITVGEECHQLRKGDCLAMQLDGLTMFHNPTRKPTRYAVVIACEPPRGNDDHTHLVLATPRSASAWAVA